MSVEGIKLILAALLMVVEMLVGSAVTAMAHQGVENIIVGGTGAASSVGSSLATITETITATKDKS